MSAKELGQIHSVSDTFDVAAVHTGTVHRRQDLAGGLCDKLQRMVRQGNYFKLVGIDLSIAPATPGPLNGGTLSGYFRYYAPTKGRCAAFRHAFKAQADQMKMQGIPMRENAAYDFRVSLSEQATGPTLINQSTMNGTSPLTLYTTSFAGNSLLRVYNKSVLPNNDNTPAADLFDEGFDTLLQSGAGKTDFVLNEGNLWEGNDNFADLSFERIPFQVAYSAGSGATTATVQWRPDPALYVAVMTGNLEMVIEDCTVDGTTALDVEVTYYVSGWKSIMGNPDKKKKRRSRSSVMASNLRSFGKR